MFLQNREKSTKPETGDEDESADVSDIVNQYLASEKDTVCGIGRCRGGALQFLANPVVYLIASSLIALVQGLFYTYSNATLSTVEKDFGLPSRLSGFTTTGNDVIQLLLSIPLPFFASRSHRPRWLAFGMFLSCAGCVLAMCPHFIFSSRNHLWHEPNSHHRPNSSWSQTLHCNTTNPESTVQSNECTLTSEDAVNFTTHGVVAFFLIGQMFAGVATLLYYTIGYSYMDEAVAKENVPLFLAISGAMRLLGPVCGYSLASKALSVWKEPHYGASVPFSPDHPRWIGAWWIGYAVIASVLLGISWVLLLLPKTLPSSRQRMLKELQKAAQSGRQDFLHHVTLLRPTKSPKWRDLLECGQRLATNAIYRLVVLKQVLFWFAFFGYVTFKSKYLEHQFKMSAAEANRYIAVVSLVAALIGWLGTGATLSVFKPPPKTVIIFMIILSGLSCFCHVGQLMISCDPVPIEGLDKVISNASEGWHSTRLSCEDVCSCASMEFSPVCLNKTATFFNSCFEKCANGGHRLENLQEDLVNIPDIDSGFCAQECSSFVLYLVLSVIAKMAQAASRVPVNILLLRCCEERDKDLGLGVFNAAIALGSSIPAPIILGWAIDSTCILWDVSCHGKMACWIYDVDTFRIFLHGVPAGVLGLAIIVDLFLLRHHGTLELYSDSNGEGLKKKQKVTLQRAQPPQKEAPLQMREMSRREKTVIA